MISINKTKHDRYVPFPSRNDLREARSASYQNPVLLKVEDIFGFMMTYRRPFDLQDVKYLWRRRRELTKEVCARCYRLTPEEQPADKQRTRVFDIPIPNECKRLGKLVVESAIKKLPLKCDDCRVLKLKIAMTKEIREARWELGIYYRYMPTKLKSK